MAEIKSQAVLDKIKEKIAAADPNPANRKALIVVDIKITQDGKVVKEVVMDLKKLELTAGPFKGTPEITLTVDDLTLALLAKKEITIEDAIKQGNLKIEGDADSKEKLTALHAKQA